MINPRVADRQQCNARILALIKLTTAVIIYTYCSHQLPLPPYINDIVNAM